MPVLAALVSTRPASPAPAPTRATARGPVASRPGASQRPVGQAARPPLTVRALGTAAVRLGDVELTAADWGYAKPRELLFLLVSSPPQTREQLGAALWPDLARQQLGNALHTALRELRRALGDPRVDRLLRRQVRVQPRAAPRLRRGHVRVGPRRRQPGPPGQRRAARPAARGRRVRR